MKMVKHKTRVKNGTVIKPWHPNAFLVIDVILLVRQVLVLHSVTFSNVVSLGVVSDSHRGAALAKDRLGLPGVDP